MKILLIEDDADTSRFVANGLRERGHVVDQSEDGRDGLFLASEAGYDVMVIDRMLPRVDGLAIVKTVRAAGVKAPVLMLTTLAGVNDRVEGLEAGADDYLREAVRVRRTARPRERARAPPADHRRGIRAARGRPGDGPAEAHGHARRAGASSCSSRNSSCSSTSMRNAGPRSDPHHAARERMGVPFRPAHQRGRDPHQPPARQGGPRLRARADPYGARLGVSPE